MTASTSIALCTVINTQPRGVTRAAQSSTWASDARPAKRCNTASSHNDNINREVHGFTVFNTTFRHFQTMTRGRVTLALALVLASVLAMSGCSTVTIAKLGYNQAPDLAYWWLDDYADFNGAQSLQVKAALARLQDWHRQTQLPVYAQSLKLIRAQVPGDISADQACRTAAEVRSRIALVIDQIEPAAANVASSLQPAQLDTLARKFTKVNAEWRSDFIESPAKKVQAKRFKQTRERFEMLYGSLSDAQNDALKLAITQSVFDPKMAYAERLRRQQDTLQTLKAITAEAAPSADAGTNARASVHALIGRALTSPDAPYRRYQEALTAEGCAMFAEVHQRATPAQRRQAAQTLQRYEALMLSLAEAP